MRLICNNVSLYLNITVTFHKPVLSRNSCRISAFDFPFEFADVAFDGEAEVVGCLEDGLDECFGGGGNEREGSGIGAIELVDGEVANECRNARDACFLDKTGYVEGHSQNNIRNLTIQPHLLHKTRQKICKSDCSRAIWGRMQHWTIMGQSNIKG